MKFKFSLREIRTCVSSFGVPMGIYIPIRLEDLSCYIVVPVKSVEESHTLREYLKRAKRGGAALRAVKWEDIQGPQTAPVARFLEELGEK